MRPKRCHPCPLGVCSVVRIMRPPRRGVVSWNIEAQQAVKDCEHTGNCPCRPEECEVCKGTGMVILLSHRPYGLIRGADGPLIAVGRSNDPAPYVGFVVG